MDTGWKIGNSAGHAVHQEAPRPDGPRVLRPVVPHRITEGTRLATLVAEHATAGWQLPSHRWWARPRTASTNRANAAWTRERCTHCGLWHLHLTATCSLGPGTEIVTTDDSMILGGGPALPWEVTFDGGARPLGDARAAGAAALLWGPPASDGSRKVLARALVALPGEPHAQVAEAWGGKLSTDLLTTLAPADRRAHVIGDNLAVVRYGAERGALRRPGMHGPLAASLARAAEKGWHLAWTAVRRRLNKAADAAATTAVHWAHRLRQQGCTAPVVHIQWF